MMVRNISAILLLVLTLSLAGCSKVKPIPDEKKVPNENPIEGVISAPAKKMEAVPPKSEDNKTTAKPPKLSPMELMKKGTVAAKELKDRFNLKSVLVSLNSKEEYDGIAISESTISDELVKLISDSKDLSKWLDLQTCVITDKQLSEFSNLKSLKRIQITDTSITGSSLRMLEEFEHLENLNLSGCIYLTDDNLPMVRGLTKLNILGCLKISDASVPKLGSMTKLKTLNICETGISSKGRADLKKLLPNCKIISG